MTKDYDGKDWPPDDTFEPYCHDCGTVVERCVCDDRDSKRLTCTCPVDSYHPWATIMEDCPRHGIAASNARQNRYWQRVGGHPESWEYDID